MSTKIPILFELLSERGITQKRLSEETGISTGNISDWKSGKSSPKPEALTKIAKCLNCSVEYLIGQANNPGSDKLNSNTINNFRIEEDERILLEAYRELNAEGKKQAVIYVTEFLLQNARFTQKSDSHDVKEA